MLLKTITIWLVVMVCLAGFSGCGKSSNEPPAPQEQTKTAAEYKAEAEKEITEENADAELKKLEQSIDQEAAGGQ
jgi:excinuclease UvrABC ATPase subunit